MINREIEASFADYITAGVSGTSLVGVSIRSGIPSESLSYPAVIVQANSSEVLEGGARQGSRINVDISVVSSASNESGWQTAHKNRVGALAKLMDDTNINPSLASINAAQSDYTLYGWALAELASETSANHQADSFRLAAVAGDRIGTTPTGPTNAGPQDFSLRHEVEQILTAHLMAELPEAVTDDYSVQPYYNEAPANGSRIVAACLSASKPFPQLARYQAQATVHVITNGADSTGHVAAVRQVQDTLRLLTTQDFTSANVTVAGVIEGSHTNDTDSNRISDVLALTLWAQVN
jgi:hypothetical protein